MCENNVEQSSKWKKITEKNEHAHSNIYKKNTLYWNYHKKKVKPEKEIDENRFSNEITRVAFAYEF